MKLLATVVIVITLACTCVNFALSASEMASITGVVQDADNGRPVADVRVLIPPSGSKTRTDEHGAFTFSELRPGSYSAIALSNSDQATTKPVAVAAGKSVSGLRFLIESSASVSGIVTGDHGEPVQNARVYLLGPEYLRGSVRYFIRRVATTGEHGEYTLANVAANRPYTLLASAFPSKLQPVSDPPREPKPRKPVYAPLYLSGGAQLEGSQVLTFKPGEHRDRIDFRLERTSSWCIGGRAAGFAGATPVHLYILEAGAQSGRSRSEDAASVTPPSYAGVVAESREFHICGLHAGEYSIMGVTFGVDRKIVDFASTTATVVNYDVTSAALDPRPRVGISIQVVASDPNLLPSSDNTIGVALEPIERAEWFGEHEQLYARVPIAGQFLMDGVFADDYNVRIFDAPARSYIKEASYSGDDVLTGPLRAGSKVGRTLRIVLADDGSTILVRVADHDGNAVAGAHVVIVPAPASSPAGVADTMIVRDADENGACVLSGMRPSKYLVIATSSAVDYSVARVNSVWAALRAAKEVEAASGNTINVTVENSPL